MGWHFFATPAIPTKNAMEQASQKVFANHGGEGFLVQPHVAATGYHQDADTVGFRSIIITLRRTSLHMIVVYFDHSIGLDSGPNMQKAQEVIKMVAAIKLPWIIVGDFNVPPEECAAGVFFSHLGGTILAPKVDLCQWQWS